MLNFTLRRILGMIPTLLVISAICFAVIQLQPGSYLDQYLDDPRVTQETVQSITRQLGLDQPAWAQYLKWVQGIVTRFDFGFSFANSRPVTSMIWDSLGWTVFLALVTMLVTWLVAVPLGVYTALNRYGKAATTMNFFGYVSLATPDYLVAMLLSALVLSMGGQNVNGLFSPEYIDAPWSWARVVDLLGHLWIPIIVLGLEGVASIMRQMRASMLDVVNQDYVRTARSKGLTGQVVLWRHIFRNAVNPLVSIAGMSLPNLINASIIGSVVLNLPTIGPLLYDSLINKDQYLAMTMLLLSAFLLLIGNLLADLALAWVDPRVRFE
ncbi:MULTISPECIES: ABC transporter permease [Deinococcus]|jgi:peptide/nickel transport system permease protein|uniref:ABC transporter permease n=2 Tax=Deinococcus TaxID=1298 RepID=A0A221T261_9DEIO|nr:MULTISPECIES: ABC transporter permease [Deinococcus]ASN82998.1 ABC transporter permease [Deinococcus ficus]MDP9763963.1 peptide/nickel transport system permease protein [Deinococcus enclensis]GHF87281.1 peptide ABC transporter permease [Deinococcus ficus]